MRRFLWFVIFLLSGACVHSQTGALQGFCNQGGGNAKVSGLASANYQQIVIPSCTVTVYLTGTTTLATIYSNSTGTPLSNPFTANVYNPATKINAGGWTFWAATNQGLDVVMSGGIAPNTYPQPVTLVDVYPSSSFSPVSGVPSAEGTVPIEVNGVSGTPQTGNIDISCPTCSGQGSLISQLQYPATCIQAGGTNNCLVMYPNGATSTGTQLCTGGATSAISTFAAASPFTGRIQRVNSNPTLCPEFANITWNGTGPLPSFILPANVLDVYGGYVSNVLCSINNANHCGFWSQTVNGIAVSPGTNGWQTETFSTLLCSSCGSFNYSSVQWIAQNDSTITWIGNPPYGGDAHFAPFVIVVYTGSAPPATTQVQVAAPLLYNQGILSLPLCFDCAPDDGGPNAYAATVPGYLNLVSGTTVKIAAGNSNTISNPTFDLSSSAGDFGAFPIVGPTGAALATTGGGDIQAGHEAILVFDPDSKWHLQNPYVSGGGSGSVSVNGSPISNPNFNGSSPSPDASFIANTFKVSASNVINETPFATNSAFGVIKPDGTSCTVTSGVLSCSGSSGVSQIVAGTNISISPSGGTGAVTINSTGGGGGSQIAANAVFVFTGQSGNDDDGHAGSNPIDPIIPINSFSTSGTTTTINTTSAHGLSVGQWISVRGATGWPAPAAQYILATGYTLFQVATVPSSTQITISTALITAGSCASSCGSINSAMGYLPFATTSQSAFPSGSNNRTYMFLPADVTIRGLDTGFAAMFASSGTQITCPVSVPTYLFINSDSNDVEIGRTASQIETNYSDVFQQAHACGMTVVPSMPTPVNINQQFSGAIYGNFYFVSDWLRGQGKTPGNPTQLSSGQYWDILYDAGTDFNDLYNPDIYNQNTGGLSNNGLYAYGQGLTNCLVAGACPLSPIGSAEFGNITDNTETTAANGVLYRSRCAICSFAWQWINSTTNSRIFSLEATHDNDAQGGTFWGTLMVTGSTGTGNGQSMSTVENPNAHLQVNDVTASLDTPSFTPNSDQENNLNILRMGKGWQLTNAYIAFDLESTSSTNLNALAIWLDGATNDSMHAVTNGICVDVATVNQSGNTHQGCPTTDAFSVGTTGQMKVDSSGNTTVNNLTCTGSGCPGPPFKSKVTVAPSSSSLASITSGSMTVAASDLVVVACSAASGVTGITVTDGLSNTWHALTFESNSSNGNANLQVAWSSITNAGSDTFTCTPSASATYQAMNVLDYTGTLGTANTSAGSNAGSLSNWGFSNTRPYIASASFTTTQRTLAFFCTAFGLSGSNSVQPWNIGGNPAAMVGLGADDDGSLAIPFGCEVATLPNPVTSGLARIEGNFGGLGNSNASSLLAINY